LRSFSPTAPSTSFGGRPTTNDLLSIAVDSHLNDFVMTVRPSTAGVLVAPAHSSGPLSNPIHITDPNIVQYVSVAIDSDDNLLIAGYDIQGMAIIDTFGTSRRMTSPPLLRSSRVAKPACFRAGGFFSHRTT